MSNIRTLSCLAAKDESPTEAVTVSSNRINQSSKPSSPNEACECLDKHTSEEFRQKKYELNQRISLLRQLKKFLMTKISKRNQVAPQGKRFEISKARLRRKFFTLSQNDKRVLKAQISILFPFVFKRPPLKAFKRTLAKMKLKIVNTIGTLSLVSRNPALSESITKRTRLRSERINQNSEDIPSTKAITLQNKQPSLHKYLGSNKQLNATLVCEDEVIQKNHRGLPSVVQDNLGEETEIKQIKAQQMSDIENEENNWRYNLMVNTNHSSNREGFVWSIPRSEMNSNSTITEKKNKLRDVFFRRKNYIPVWFLQLFEKSDILLELKSSLSSDLIVRSKDINEFTMVPRRLILSSCDKSRGNCKNGRFFVTVTEQQQLHNSELDSTLSRSKSVGDDNTLFQNNDYTQNCLPRVALSSKSDNEDCSSEETEDNKSTSSTDSGVLDSPSNPFFPVERQLSFRHNWKWFEPPTEGSRSRLLFKTRNFKRFYRPKRRSLRRLVTEFRRGILFEGPDECYLIENEKYYLQQSRLKWNNPKDESQTNKNFNIFKDIPRSLGSANINSKFLSKITNSQNTDIPVSSAGRRNNILSFYSMIKKKIRPNLTGHLQKPCSSKRCEHNQGKENMNMFFHGVSSQLKKEPQVGSKHLKMRTKNKPIDSIHGSHCACQIESADVSNTQVIKESSHFEVTLASGENMGVLNIDRSNEDDVNKIGRNKHYLKKKNLSSQDRNECAKTFDFGTSHLPTSLSVTKNCIRSVKRLNPPQKTASINALQDNSSNISTKQLVGKSRINISNNAFFSPSTQSFSGSSFHTSSNSPTGSNNRRTPPSAVLDYPIDEDDQTESDNGKKTKSVLTNDSLKHFVKEQWRRISQSDNSDDSLPKNNPGLYDSDSFENSTTAPDGSEQLAENIDLATQHVSTPHHIRSHRESETSHSHENSRHIRARRDDDFSCLYDLNKTGSHLTQDANEPRSVGKSGRKLQSPHGLQRPHSVDHESRTSDNLQDCYKTTANLQSSSNSTADIQTSSSHKCLQQKYPLDIDSSDQLSNMSTNKLLKLLSTREPPKGHTSRRNQRRSCRAKDPCELDKLIDTLLSAPGYMDKEKHERTSSSCDENGNIKLSPKNPFRLGNEQNLCQITKEARPTSNQEHRSLNSHCLSKEDITRQLRQKEETDTERRQRVFGETLHDYRVARTAACYRPCVQRHELDLNSGRESAESSSHACAQEGLRAGFEESSFPEDDFMQPKRPKASDVNHVFSPEKRTLDMTPVKSVKTSSIPDACGQDSKETCLCSPQEQSNVVPQNECNRPLDFCNDEGKLTTRSYCHKATTLCNSYTRNKQGGPKQPDSYIPDTKTNYIDSISPSNCIANEMCYPATKECPCADLDSHLTASQSEALAYINYVCKYGRVDPKALARFTMAKSLPDGGKQFMYISERNLQNEKLCPPLYNDIETEDVNKVSYRTNNMLIDTESEKKLLENKSKNYKLRENTTGSCLDTEGSKVKEDRTVPLTIDKISGVCKPVDKSVSISLIDCKEYLVHNTEVGQGLCTEETRLAINDSDCCNRKKECSVHQDCFKPGACQTSYVPGAYQTSYKPGACQTAYEPGAGGSSYKSGACQTSYKAERIEIDKQKTTHDCPRRQSSTKINMGTQFTTQDLIASIDKFTKRLVMKKPRKQTLCVNKKCQVGSPFGQMSKCTGSETVKYSKNVQEMPNLQSNVHEDPRVKKDKNCTRNIHPGSSNSFCHLPYKTMMEFEQKCSHNTKMFNESNLRPHQRRTEVDNSETKKSIGCQCPEYLDIRNRVTFVDTKRHGPSDCIDEMQTQISKVNRFCQTGNVEVQPKNDENCEEKILVKSSSLDACYISANPELSHRVPVVHIQYRSKPVPMPANLRAPQKGRTEPSRLASKPFAPSKEMKASLKKHIVQILEQTKQIQKTAQDFYSMERDDANQSCYCRGSESNSKYINNRSCNSNSNANNFDQGPISTTDNKTKLYKQEPECSKIPTTPFSRRHDVPSKVPVDSKHHCLTEAKIIQVAKNNHVSSVHLQQGNSTKVNLKSSLLTASMSSTQTERHMSRFQDGRHIYQKDHPKACAERFPLPSVVDKDICHLLDPYEETLQYLHKHAGELAKPYSKREFDHLKLRYKTPHSQWSRYTGSIGNVHDQTKLHHGNVFEDSVTQLVTGRCKIDLHRDNSNAYVKQETKEMVSQIQSNNLHGSINPQNSITKFSKNCFQFQSSSLSDDSCQRLLVKNVQNNNGHEIKDTSGSDRGISLFVNDSKASSLDIEEIPFDVGSSESVPGAAVSVSKNLTRINTSSTHPLMQNLDLTHLDKPVENIKSNPSGRRELLEIVVPCKELLTKTYVNKSCDLNKEIRSPRQTFLQQRESVGRYFQIRAIIDNKDTKKYTANKPACGSSSKTNSSVVSENNLLTPTVYRFKDDEAMLEHRAIQGDDETQISGFMNKQRSTLTTDSKSCDLFQTSIIDWWNSGDCHKERRLQQPTSKDNKAEVPSDAYISKQILTHGTTTSLTNTRQQSRTGYSSARTDCLNAVEKKHIACTHHVKDKYRCQPLVESRPTSNQTTHAAYRRPLPSIKNKAHEQGRKQILNVGQLLFASDDCESISHDPSKQTKHPQKLTSPHNKRGTCLSKRIKEKSSSDLPRPSLSTRSMRREHSECPYLKSKEDNRENDVTPDNFVSLEPMNIMERRPPPINIVERRPPPIKTMERRHPPINNMERRPPPSLLQAKTLSNVLESIEENKCHLKTSSANMTDKVAPYLKENPQVADSTKDEQWQSSKISVAPVVYANEERVVIDGMFSIPCHTDVSLTKPKQTSSKHACCTVIDDYDEKFLHKVKNLSFRLVLFKDGTSNMHRKRLSGSYMCQMNIDGSFLKWNISGFKELSKS